MPKKLKKIKESYHKVEAIRRYQSSAFNSTSVVAFKIFLGSIKSDDKNHGIFLIH